MPHNEKSTSPGSGTDRRPRDADPQALTAAMPVAATLGLEIKEATPEHVRASITWSPTLCSIDGMLHGGVLMAAADATGGTCAALHLPAGVVTVAVDSKANVLRPIRSGIVTVTAVPIYTGNQSVVVDTELHDAAGRLVAVMMQTHAVLRGNSPVRA